MRLLLDENLPHEFRHEIPGHDVTTVAFMGWKGFRNGRLLELVSAAGFDAIITKDLSIPKQHSVNYASVAIIVLRASSNAIEVLRPLVPAMLKAIQRSQPGRVFYVGP
jgi:predicted nuclease of predicted toxin-antitoxin system